MKLLLLALLVLLALPSTAMAYIDGASGSVILQTLIGLAAGVWIFVKVFWHKVTGLCVSGRNRRRPQSMSVIGAAGRGIRRRFRQVDSALG